MTETEYTRQTLGGLSRDTLRRMLSQQLQKAPPQIDDALVRMLLRELESRGDDPDYYDDEAIEAACEAFRQATQSAKPQKRWRQSWLVKAASVLLVLGILFLGLPATAQADDFRGIISWWSDSVFQLLTPGKQPLTQPYVYETDHPGLQQIYDAVTELGVTEPIVPMWVPKEFVLVELKVYPFLEGSVISAQMETTNQHLLISYVINKENTIFQHEKDLSDLQIWDLAGLEHYMVSNNNEHIITWYTNRIEGAVTTDCTEEDVYRIIKSIYTLEG